MSLLLLFAGARARARIEIEAELNGVDNGWTVLSDAQRVPAITIDYGLGAGPLDLVAGTGSMTFALDNGPSNSAATLGLYSPDHANCLAGWGLGIRVRFAYTLSGTTYYKFLGTVDNIDPMSGLYQERKVLVTAVDWMEEAAIYKPNTGTQESKRADEVLDTLVDAMPKQPYSRDFDTCEATFDYALDTDRSEADPVMTVMQRLAASEGLGRIYVKGDTVGGGVLKLESRIARFAPSSVATFNDTMIRLSAPHGRRTLINRVKATTHPREVGSAASTNVFNLARATGTSIHLVRAGATVVFDGAYRDTTNANRRFGATDLVAPVATTDYTMNELASGGGASATADFSVSAEFGANRVRLTVTNNGAVDAYITLLKCRGRKLADYDSVDTIATDDDSITEFGERELVVDMTYESEAIAAQSTAEYILGVWSQPAASDIAMPLIPANDTDLATIIAREPGDAITITESVTGVNSVHYINHVSMSFEESTLINCEWVVQRTLNTPVVRSRTTSSENAAVTSHTVSLPSDIEAGDLLIAAVTTDGTIITFPAGWNTILSQAAASGSQMKIAYRDADGTEGATITVTTALAAESTHASLRIYGAEDPGTQAPEGSSTFGDTTTDPINPPSLTPTGGRKNYLWLSFAAFAQPPAVSAFAVPAPYINPQYEADGAAFVMTTCERTKLAASEDPGEYTVNGSREWIGATVAVHPVG